MIKLEGNGIKVGIVGIEEDAIGQIALSVTRST